VKNFLIRILLAATLTLVAFALAAPAQAQQADEDPARATPREQQPTATPKSPQEPQAPAPSSGDAHTNDAQTQHALAFTGRIANEGGHLVLRDPVTKMSYGLDDPSKAKPYLGKQVKVVGKLDTKINTIQIESIEPLS
jgi:Protein of unknown function (DUF5818)